MSHANTWITIGRFAAILLLALLVAACGPELPTPGASMQSPIRTPVATPTPARDPTATPVPPRATPTSPAGWLADNVQVVRHGPIAVPPDLLRAPYTGYYRPVFAPDGERFLVEVFTDQLYYVEAHDSTTGIPRPELWLVEHLDQPQPTMTRLTTDGLGASWSPGGSRIAYLRVVRPEENQVELEVWVMNADGDDQTLLVAGAAPTGTAWRGQSILYVDANTYQLMEVSLKGEITGPLLDTPVWGDGATLLPSPDGTKVLVVKPSGKSAQVVNLDTGAVFDLSGLDEHGVSSGPMKRAWSPDSRYVAYHNRMLTLLIVDTEQSLIVNRIPLEDDPITWSPDGQSLITSHSDQAGHTTIRIFGRDAGLSDRGRSLIELDDYTLGVVWSPNGRWLIHTHGTASRIAPSLAELAISSQSTNIQEAGQ